MNRPKVRKVAFYSITGAWSVFLVLFFGFFGIAETILLFFGDSVFVSLVPDTDQTQMIHRIHFLALAMIYAILTIAVGVQLRKPEHKVAPLLMALAYPVVNAVMEAATGVVHAGPYIHLGPLVLIALLHPRARQLVSIPKFDWRMTVLTVAVAIPWLLFAVGQANLQRLHAPSDPHAAMEHWELMAAFAVLVPLWALIGSTQHSGWRITSWLVSFAAALYGVQSLLHPELESAASSGLAIASLVWGILFLIAAEHRVRREAATIATDPVWSDARRKVVDESPPNPHRS